MSQVPQYFPMAIISTGSHANTNRKIIGVDLNMIFYLFSIVLSARMLMS